MKIVSRIMNTRNRICTSACAVALSILILGPSRATAAGMAAGPDAPAIDGEDIANYGEVTGTDKWWASTDPNAGAAKGQTFTTGNTSVKLYAITYKTNGTVPTKTYAIRVGTVVGTTFTEIHSEDATQDFAWDTGDYVTWTFDSPVLLEPNTTYGVDVGLRSTTSSWQDGIPYIHVTDDEYADGVRYQTGSSGIGTDTLSINSSSDRIFHLDLEHPMSPSPQNGEIVSSGDVVLSWVNFDPSTGSDVWVDVWYGTDPDALDQVVDGGLNATTSTVSAPVADTYYWRVDSYLDGDANGTPVIGDVFSFVVDDTDGDGLPDEFELLYTDPPSNVDMNPDDDLDSDGLTNLEEYGLGTDPVEPDSDGDGIVDGYETNTGVWTDSTDTGTDPLVPDSDGDGIIDGYETNTGVWTGSTDTGTDPLDPDSDGDGLLDGAETNTGSFVDATDTGTDPLDPDSDGDGAGDWYEVYASFTDPLDPNDKPNIPYPLPAPDGSVGVTNKPVKVYILSGQSNMVGFGTVGGTDPGTLTTITGTEGKFPNLTDAGAWTERSDVMYRGVISAIGNGPLKPGYGASGSYFGPELGFGHVMGYHFDEPVLIIKSSIGNRSLGWDVLPTTSEQFQWTDGTGSSWTYAGYGDSPARWETGTVPVPIGWYAGKEFDRFFLDEADHAPAGGDESFNVTDVLDDFANEYPQWADQGFEIAGYVWWQGHKDQGEPYASRYEANMVRFVKQLRLYYENRYPDNTSPEAPIVLATIAFAGWDLSGAGLTVANGQLAVSGETGNYPEFEGNVKTIEARSYWRDADVSPTGTGYHYNHNAETYMLVGDALGRGMVEMLQNAEGSSGDYGTWSEKYPTADLSDPNADYDGDGMSNNAERIWGLDPTNADSRQSFEREIDPVQGSFGYTRRDPGLTGLQFSVWVSTDLNAWIEDIGATQTATGMADDVETAAVTVSPTYRSLTKLFVSVRATE